MSCAHSISAQFESAFAIDASRIVFGPGALGEVGEHVRSLGCKRVALFTDPRVGALEHVAVARASLQNANIDFAVYDAVRVEPTDASFRDAARFASEGRFDGYVSVGGGSTIDTCKAASLYATFPVAEFLDYVNAPVGAGKPVPGALPPHVACPTTCGTGSETTGIAVCDVLALGAKTGIASARLRPSLALVDPTCTYTLPAEVVAASGFDVLCHALESYTARPFDARTRGLPRPMSQGANPWSDMGSWKAIEIVGSNLERAVNTSETAPRDALAWAATLAGVAFGNSGVHIPHAMAYAVAGLVRDFKMRGYPQDEPMVPHGISVVLNAPAAFRFTGRTSPERHIASAAMLGMFDAKMKDVAPEDAGVFLARARRTDGARARSGRAPRRRLHERRRRRAHEGNDRPEATLVERAARRRRGRAPRALFGGDVKRDDYRFFLPIATRWIDNDVYGHVNNVVYYAYFDTVINRWLIDEGGLDIAKGEVIGVCAESQCTYLHSASFPDALDAGLRVSKIGRSSVSYEIGIFLGETLCAHGRFVHVFVDRASRKPTPIPSRIRAALERIR